MAMLFISILVQNLFMEALSDLSAILLSGNVVLAQLPNTDLPIVRFNSSSSASFWKSRQHPSTVEELQKRIKREIKKLHVFSDRISLPTSFSDVFDYNVALQSDSSVSPIFMSTHRGAINAVRKGRDSRVSFQKWCKVFVGLSKY